MAAPKNMSPSAYWIIPGIQLPTAQCIVSAVSDYFKVSLESVTGKSRNAKLAKARRVAYALMREAGFTYRAIGNYIGKRDHSTIMQQIQNQKNYCRIYEEEKAEYESLRSKFNWN